MTVTYNENKLYFTVFHNTAFLKQKRKFNLGINKLTLYAVKHFILKYMYSATVTNNNMSRWIFCILSNKMFNNIMKNALYNIQYL